MNYTFNPKTKIRREANGVVLLKSPIDVRKVGVVPGKDDILLETDSFGYSIIERIKDVPGISLRALVDWVQKKYNVNRQTAEDDLREFLAELVRCEIVACS